MSDRTGGDSAFRFEAAFPNLAFKVWKEGDVPGQVSQRNMDAFSKASRIYVATVRTDGNQSKPVPVWFTLTPGGQVLIQTRPTSWIARRVGRGSPVIVWIGRRHGFAFIGNAEISNDSKLTKQIVNDYPRKYMIARLGLHRPTQERFDAGHILAIKITPVRDLPEGFGSRPGLPAPGFNGTEPLIDRQSPRRHGIARWQLANLLSASRFALAALWLAAFACGKRSPEILGPIALAAALSDFADGRVARWIGDTDGFGSWLDSLADIVFILTALSSEARAGAIPIYIPALIAASFAQYAIDSIAISSSSAPVKSRLGHYGGIINFALVLVLAWTPQPLSAARLVTQAAPLLAIFYIAAIFERTLNYRPLAPIFRNKLRKRDCAGSCSV